MNVSATFKSSAAMLLISYRSGIRTRQPSTVIPRISLTHEGRSDTTPLNRETTTIRSWWTFSYASKGTSFSVATTIRYTIGSSSPAGGQTCTELTLRWPWFKRESLSLKTAQTGDWKSYTAIRKLVRLG